MKASPLKFWGGSRACYAKGLRQRVGCESIIRHTVDLVGWIVPGAVLALISKCPICFAAYIALWTGIGLSISAAIYLRASLLVVSTVLILFLALRSVRRLIHKFGHGEQSVA